jgi:hypothetical protein
MSNAWNSPKAKPRAITHEAAAIDRAVQRRSIFPALAQQSVLDQDGQVQNRQDLR